MKLRTVFILLMIAVFALTLAACGNGNKKTQAETEPKTTEAEVDFDEDEEDETSSEPTDDAGEQTSEKSDEEEKEEASEEDGDSTAPEDEESGEAAADPSESGETTPGSADSIVSTARSLIGTEFEYGMAGPEKFDNPGFVYYCFKENGIEIPRRTSEMTSVGSPVSRDELRSGDIVIFSNEIGGEPDFSGIYVGDGQFISCNNENSPTGIRSFSGYWGERFIEGRRVAE